MQPVVKWTGGKRLSARFLADRFPSAYQRYVEPFLGGGALLPYRKCATALAADVVPELIALWQSIQVNPDQLVKESKLRWELFQKNAEYFYVVRERFNRDRDPADFLFLTRTSANGLVRYNKQKQMNNSVHHNRWGIQPERLKKIIAQWHQIVQGVTFVCQDYRQTFGQLTQGDFIFCDPPYLRTRGQYYVEKFDHAVLFQNLAELNKKDVRWMLTLDGIPNSVPDDLWLECIDVPPVVSAFLKLKGVQHTASDRMYVNYSFPDTRPFF